MKRIINVFSNKYVFITSCLIFLLFLVVILPDQAEKAAQFTPDNGSFDTAFYYSPQSVYSKIAAYGDAGRRAYIINRWTFDLIFPLAYGFFLLSAISFSIRRFHWQILQNKRWALIPLLAVTFDFLENSFVTILMHRYPVEINILTYGASLATLLKWIFVDAGMVLAFLFPLLLGISKLIALIIRKKRVEV